MATTTRLSETELSIEPTQPFDFEQSLAFGRGVSPCLGNHRCSSRTLTTGGYADGNPFVVRITRGEQQLQVDVEWLDAPGPIGEVAAWVGAFLSLGDDLTGLYEAAADDPAFERVVDDLYGYHHVRFPTPFEAACWAAISQRTPMQVSERIKRGIVEACGRVVEIDGGAVALFPTPQMVCDAAPAVREAIGHERKEKTLLGAASVFADENLSALGDTELRERLAAIWGFGDWSSEFIALRGFGRLSRIPRTERRLREAVATLYGLDVPEASDADLDRLSDPYAPLEGYWAHYIRVWAFYSSLEGEPVK